jgi:uncharacterized OB-fold protein
MPSVPEKICRMMLHSTVKAWRERDGRYRLQGVVCKDCGKKIFPAVQICPYCHSKNLEKTEFASTGKIVLSPEPLWYPLTGFQELLPQYTVMIELDDGPFVCAELVHYPPPAEFKEGTRVEMAFRKLKREDIGNYVYGFKFRIVE